MSKRNGARGQQARVIAPGSRFSEHRLTGRAGLIMVARFARKLGLAGIIEGTVHLERGPNVRYKVGMILTGIALGIVSGCRHISHLCELAADEVFMKTQGWKSFPVVSAITHGELRGTGRGSAQTSTEGMEQEVVWSGAP